MWGVPHQGYTIYSNKNMDEEINNALYHDLLKIQKSLKTVVKDKKAFKGSYATIENVWESIRKTINDNNFVVTHSAIQEGVRTTAIHCSGEVIQSLFPWSDNKDPQEKGKEITYAKRYNINAIFNVIVADEDTDASKPVGNYKKKEVSGELAAKKITNAKTRDEALEAYKSLSKEERTTAEVIAAVDEMRKKYKDEDSK